MSPWCQSSSPSVSTVSLPVFKDFQGRVTVKKITVSSLTVNTVISEQHRENSNLTAQNLQLRTQKADLERQMEELSREKDRLNWTMGVIMEYENFPVNAHCPQKGENMVQPTLVCWVFLLVS